MEYERITSLNRNRIDAFIKQHWYTTTMIIRGKAIDMTKTEGFYFREGEDIIGLITYMVYDNLLEIISLDSLHENQGIGSKLLGAVIHEAKERKLQKIVLITTNDNINAMKFYQKRGFDMVRLFHDALAVSRKLKPEIPLIGENSIPLRHEIEFELYINPVIAEETI
ncbi:MAG: GNAT family N-acetyltransferase [Hungatella sp.]|nr:GNAT family N-acetyltransferase [Hungatella sp.]